MKKINLQKPNLVGIYSNNNFDSEKTFISYFNQYKLILDLNPKSILEVGVGSGILNILLKSKNFNITTCDYDKNLKPDFVGDIRKLPFKNNVFDCAVAFEVLEHIPFKDFRLALNELKRVSKKYVVISVPYKNYCLELNIFFPLFRKKVCFLVPAFFKNWVYDGVHYWEMGTKSFSKSKIKQEILSCGFKIKKEFKSDLNKYHYFFILEK